MDDRDLVFKAGIALDGRQVLNIHLGPVATRCQRMHRRTFGFKRQVVVENKSDCAESEATVLAPQFRFNTNWPVLRMSQPVVNNGLSVGVCHAPVMVFWGTALVVAVLAFDPFTNRSSGGIELSGQVGVANLAAGIELLNLLPLIGRKSRILMKFHQVRT